MADLTGFKNLDDSCGGGQFPAPEATNMMSKDGDSNPEPVSPEDVGMNGLTSAHEMMSNDGDSNPDQPVSPENVEMDMVDLDTIGEEIDEIANKWIESNIKKRKPSQFGKAIATQTDAYGDVQFIGYGDITSKYCRLDVGTSTEKTLSMLLKAWGLPQPNLVISVTGGALDFEMDHRLRATFHRGLMKAVQSTGGWIITGGTHAGVMKHVGQAVKEYQLTSQDDKQVVAIGIAPWGCVSNKELLINDMENKQDGSNFVAKYKAGELTRTQVPLDPSHTHFLLIDDGSQEKFGTEITFRSVLETEISDKSIEIGVFSPVVLVVVEGGPNTLETAYKSAEQGKPIVVIKNSGRVADILAYAAQHCERDEEGLARSFSDTVETGVKRMIKKHLNNDKHTDDENEKRHKKHLGWVKYIVERIHLLTVFELGGTGDASCEIDVAILRALMKATDKMTDRLAFTMDMGRIDITREYVFADENPLSTEELYDGMLKALKSNKANFVELLIDHGVHIKNFVNKNTMQELYNSTDKSSFLRHLLTRNRRKTSLQPARSTNGELSDKDDRPFQLNDIGALLRYFFERKGEVELYKYDEKTLGGSQALFLWAVLECRQDLADLFWRMLREPLAFSLMGHFLCKSMSADRKSCDVKSKLKTIEKLFEDESVRLVTELYASNENKTEKLLTRQMTSWGLVSPIYIAVFAENKKFVATPAYQSVLSDLWRGSMAYDYNLLWIMICAFCPPLILRYIEFDFYKQDSPAQTGKHGRSPSHQTDKPEQPQGIQKQRATIEKEEGGQQQLVKKSPVWIQKLKGFYTAPVVVFLLNVLFYIGFLTLYSFVLLVSARDRSISAAEIVLIIWIATLFLEEIHQAGRSSHVLRKFSWRIEGYLRDKWNILDLIIIVLFIVGMILRGMDNYDVFVAGRIILALDLMFCFMRMIHVFSFHVELGPKLVMIQRMMKDLFYFMAILFLFMATYAIVSESILDVHDSVTAKYVFIDLFKKAYFHIYGELFLEDYTGSTTAGEYIVMYLMGIYMVICNVLLLNLLIAMFSTTYQQIQDQTGEYWNWQRHHLIQEYYSRPFLPPPLIIFCHIAELVTWCTKKCRRSNVKQSSRGFLRKLTRNDEKVVLDWEEAVFKQYVQKQTAKDGEKLETKASDIVSRIESISDSIVAMQDQIASSEDKMRDLLEQHLSRLENVSSGRE